MVTGESGSDEDRERDQLLRRATELRGSITRAQDRYGAIMDAFKTTEEIALGLPSKQVRLFMGWSCVCVGNSKTLELLAASSVTTLLMCRV